MFSAYLLASLSCCLFVYKRIEGVNVVESVNEERNKNAEQLRLNALTNNFSSHTDDIGTRYVNWQKNKGIEISLDSRSQDFRDFKKNVVLLRSDGFAKDDTTRYIDKIDYSLEISTVRSESYAEIAELYQRQMRYISMFTADPNPFQKIRDLFSDSSVFNRPENFGYLKPTDFSGSFGNFLLDYYFHMYYTNENDWKIYIMKQRMALNEIEKDVFSFLNAPERKDEVASDREVTATVFSTIGLEIIANLLRPGRAITPQVEKFESAFSQKIWKRYFPYTWAMVNSKEAAKEIQNNN